MKTFRIAFAVLALAFGSTGWGQSVFLKYGPVAGIQKSTGSTWQNTAAASSDIIGLWSGCSGSNFLRGDGTCTVPAGTGVTSVAVPAPLTATTCSGGACVLSWTTGQTANRILATPDGTTGAVSLRAVAAGDVPPINLGSTANGGVSSATILLGTNGGTSNGFFSVTGPTTALRTFTFPNASATVLTSNAAVTVPQGGTGLATLTANGVLLGEGTSNVNPLVMGADTVLRGTASADPVAAAVPNCGSSTTALNYSTSTHAFGCQTISTGGTGTVTNVASGTGITGGPITTTGTLSLDQAVAPTMTGQWVFTPSCTGSCLTGVTINHNSGNTASTRDILIQGTTNNQHGITVNNGSNGASAQSIVSVGSDVASVLFGATSSGNIAAPFTTGPTGGQGYIGTSSNHPVSIGSNGIERVRVVASGAVIVNAPTSGLALTITPSVNNYAERITAGSTTGQSFGLKINAGTNTSDFPLVVANPADNANDFVIDGTGGLFMPRLATSSAATNGTLCWTSATGLVNVDTTVACLSSARRFKKDIQPLDVGLQEVMHLKPVKYNLRDDPAHIGEQVGLIAEDVGVVDSRLMGTGPDGQATGVRYMQLTAVLVKAIQEQQHAIEKLQSQRVRHGHH